MDSSGSANSPGGGVSPASAGGRRTTSWSAREAQDVQPRLRGGYYSAKPAVPSVLTAAHNDIGVPRAS
eukprot:7033787-Lingulodinium_polyedra.AAC.1